MSERLEIRAIDRGVMLSTEVKTLGGKPRILIRFDERLPNYSVGLAKEEAMLLRDTLNAFIND